MKIYIRKPNAKYMAESVQVYYLKDIEATGNLYWHEAVFIEIYPLISGWWVKDSLRLLGFEARLW